MTRWPVQSGKPHPRSGDIVPQWTVADEHIKGLRELSDDLERDLSELDDGIMAIGLDLVVKANRGRSIGPSSVDCICYCNNTVYLIEFKAEKSGEGRDRIVARYPNKAIDSLVILLRLLGCCRSEKVNLIIVHQNIRQDLVGNLTAGSCKHNLPDEISWLGMRDSRNQGIYFDKVEYRSCKDFIELANRTLARSTKEALKSRFRSVLSEL